MTGLEDRLRKVQGVADLTIELGDDGLQGIRVRIDEGSDEAEVLEEIRRILVAYGIRSRRSSLRADPIPQIEPDPLPTTVELAEDDGRPLVSVGPAAGGLEVSLAGGGRRVVVRGAATPVGAAEAMARAVAEWEGKPAPEKVAVSRVSIDDDQVIVVLAQTADDKGAGAAVVGESLGEALHKAAKSALVGDC